MDVNNSLHIVVDSIPTSSHSWIDILSALLVPVIAIVGLIITYQQYKINQQRLKHELYERRLVIFKHMKTYLSEILSSGTVTYQRAMQFNYDVAESTFILNEDINNRIKEIYSKSVDMATIYERLNPADGSSGLPKGEERTKASQDKLELQLWLTNQLTELKPLFINHLSLK